MCPVLLRCSVLIKFAEARLSLLSGLVSGEGPEDFVLGKAKCATGTVFCGTAEDTVVEVLFAGTALSDMDGITRLVRIE
jgi:hypothetical protein